MVGFGDEILLSCDPGEGDTLEGPGSHRSAIARIQQFLLIYFLQPSDQVNFFPHPGSGQING
jgi:hypothetical protein